jgi:hypothetical protein
MNARPGMRWNRHRSVVRMCGIMGVFRQEGDVAPEIYEGLLMLQHRGQDSAGASLPLSSRFSPCGSVPRYIVWAASPRTHANRHEEPAASPPLQMTKPPCDWRSFNGKRQP